MLTNLFVFFVLFYSLKLAIRFKDAPPTEGVPGGSAVGKPSGVSGQGRRFHRALETCYPPPRAQTTFLALKVPKTGLPPSLPPSAAVCFHPSL